MPCYGEARAGQAVDARNAAWEPENPAASVAVEMVVVILPGAFVYGAGAGEFNCDKPPVLQQALMLR